MSIHTTKHAQVKLSTGKDRRVALGERIWQHRPIHIPNSGILCQILTYYAKLWHIIQNPCSINTKKRKNSNLNRPHVDTQNRHPPIEFLTGGKCAATILFRQ